MREALKDIFSTLEIELCLRKVVEHACALMDVEICSLMLLEKDEDELCIKAAKGLAHDVVSHACVKVGEGISGYVAEKGEPLLIEDIGRDRRFKRRDGKYHNDSLLSVPLKKADKMLGVINVNNKRSKGIFNDNDLERLSEFAEFASIAIDNADGYSALRRLSELRMNFVTTVSHEIRTPMAAIKEAVSIVLDGLTGDVNAKQRKFLDIVKNNIDRLNRLINEILDLSKMESGKLSMKRTLIDLSDITRGVCSAFHPEADKKNIVLECMPSNALPRVWADPDKITQVLGNLVNNAIKFTPKNGEVVVQVKASDSDVEVSVSDTGHGIPETEIERIFDRFYRLEGSVKMGIAGTGLGLPIAKEIVEMHRGRIWVESKEGRGSKFAFVLPRDMRVTGR